MACYVGPVQLPGGLVADSGVSGGAPAGPGFDFAVHCDPEVCLEERPDALVLGPLVDDVTGFQLHDRRE